MKLSYSIPGYTNRVSDSRVTAVYLPKGGAR